jgi:hypothetical protein
MESPADAPDPATSAPISFRPGNLSSISNQERPALPLPLTPLIGRGRECVGTARVTGNVSDDTGPDDRLSGARRFQIMSTSRCWITDEYSGWHNAAR